MSAEEALARLERRVLERGAVGRFLADIDELRRLVNAKDPRVVDLVLRLGAPRVEAEALRAVLDAYAAGVDDALGIVAADVTAPRVRPSAAALAPVAGLDGRLREALVQARRLARAGADIDVVAAPLLGAANSTRGRVTESIIGGAGEGVRQVAKEASLPVVWIAERNACVHCLAYSGRVAQPGKPFPGGLTYGAKSYYPEPLMRPALHPNCRCQLEPLNSQQFADTLRREADRSVLRGFSLESESMKVRLDAARRLLDSGVDLPASVQGYARKAIRDGKFPTRGPVGS